MKLQLICTLSLLVLLGMGQIQSQNLSLNIKKLDGGEKSIQLSQLKKITFSGTDMTLNYQTSGKESIGLALIQKITFSSFTALTDVVGDANSILVYPNPSTDYIQLKNLPATFIPIVVYSVSGTKVLTVTAPNKKIDVSKLATGIYLFKINNQIVKFSKL